MSYEGSVSHGQCEDGAEMPQTRWALSGMQKHSFQRGPRPDEANARHYCLHKGKDAPDLVTVKDFLRFYITTSRGKVVEKPTANSVKWEFHRGHAFPKSRR